MNTHRKLWKVVPTHKMGAQAPIFFVETEYTSNDGEDKSINEFDKFLSRYENDKDYNDALQELLSFILFSVGDDHGAIDELFNRYENEVTGLPPKGNIELGDFTYLKKQKNIYIKNLRKTNFFNIYC